MVFGEWDFMFGQLSRTDWSGLVQTKRPYALRSFCFLAVRWTLTFVSHCEYECAWLAVSSTNMVSPAKAKQRPMDVFELLRFRSAQMPQIRELSAS